MIVARYLLNHTLFCFSFQILPSAPPLCRPPVGSAVVGDWLKVTPTPRLHSAFSVCRSSSASIWPLPTTWCTTRPSTWPLPPRYPTWAWVWTWLPRWGPCSASLTTSPCPRPSRCGAARCFRPQEHYPALTAKQQALKICVWGPNSMQLHLAWTLYPTDHTTQATYRYRSSSMYRNRLTERRTGFCITVIWSHLIWYRTLYPRSANKCEHYKFTETGNGPYWEITATGSIFFAVKWLDLHHLCPC